MESKTPTRTARNFSCSRARHDLMKRDPALWLASTQHVGFQRLEGEPPLEFRSCSQCSSTLVLDTGGSL
jgi:hypothetical protein